MFSWTSQQSVSAADIEKGAETRTLKRAIPNIDEPSKRPFEDMVV